ncbi:microcin C ABC transporter permease YejB [Roseomonas frigidaquae]|uniref:Microcin C ABC transporter permease YejB n=1 Tax=Falsiroseomonas frigidaquae TaxID=487318 RepID=A0ABX1EYP7_9PROT|nr:microcin C ABC transporter permease YejB [Falsiroseomonas frigidaquae]NKE45207.1 microcin C ABC transporter permease YejB [Falsiroseomonas frigidaquae]
MAAYIFRRLLLVVPTLLGIILINFAVVQFAPGGPVEQMLAELRGEGQTLGRLTGEGQGETRAPGGAGMGGGGGDGPVGTYRGARGLDPAIVAEIERIFGFDKPAHVRFGEMMWGYLTFDFGRSLFRDQPVVDLVIEKMPVSISLGLWSTLIIYLVSIPLGIRKAVQDGTRFDVWTSGVVLVGYAIPGFLFAILLVVFFAGGSFLQWFPLRGLASSGSEMWPFWQRALDYAWHMALPTLALVIGGFAGLTMLTKNAFLDEIGKQYVVTARAKGNSETRILYGHVFRNAMLLIIAGFPAAFISILFTGALLVEIVFSLDGLGLLGFEAAIRRDYPIMFGTLYIFTLMGLILQIIGDVMYTVVDPRIDFEARR